MSNQISNSDDALRFTAAFESVELADEIGPQLNCEEVDALAGLLRALGEPAAAETWISSHASADDHADGHHQGDGDPYLVPVDPMEYLGCDSCQLQRRTGEPSMSTEYTGMDARELAAFARGYLEAVDDHEDELTLLRDQVTELTQQLTAAHTEADRLYHQVFCSCMNKQIARQALRDLDILHARTQMQYARTRTTPETARLRPTIGSEDNSSRQPGCSDESS